jgi:transcriptional repressor NrdR
MKCPYCTQDESRVINSRELNDSVRRRRECLSCGRRFTTYERIETPPLLVVKRDGRREEYDRRKLADSIRRACHKRPIATQKIDALVDDVESALFRTGQEEVESRLIGEMAIQRLKNLDEIAYVRYASVYHHFTDVDTLAEEIAEYKEWKQRMEEQKAQLSLTL